ncbi:MAG TPA: AraC family transcriptional regulator [Bauldia sp.]|nr:AraC family transcriptional regulator [Bauldia sp.]
MDIVGIGKVIFWAGGSLWIGRAFAAAEPHVHHAIQIAIAMSGRVQFRTSLADPWDEYHAAFIPPDVTHTFRAPGQLVANMLCAPESAVGRGLVARYGAQAIRALEPADVADDARALLAAFEDDKPDEDLEQLALDTLYALSGGAPVARIDGRIARAIDFIAARLAEPLTLDHVARQVGLSPGRFRHLFVQETGISFRAYLLWTRLNRALELGFGGASWTDAAHATNFADSAHLSRTTRRMYGLAATSIRQDITPAARPLTA